METNTIVGLVRFCVELKKNKKNSTLEIPDSKFVILKDAISYYS